MTSLVLEFTLTTRILHYQRSYLLMIFNQQRGKRAVMHRLRISWNLENELAFIESRCAKLLAPFLERQANVESLINRSFLDAASKRAYLLHYNTKRSYLNA